MSYKSDMFEINKSIYGQYISARYMLAWYQYYADKIWSQILVQGIDPGFYSFPCLTNKHSMIVHKLNNKNFPHMVQC